MALNLKKITPIELRSAGLDEKWLQDQILEDTSLLGLGELEVFSREHRQPSGGKIDFLMYEAEDKAFYEVEIMLGALDESHIIRTIEYWDLERQRRPQFDHYAVIVAEQITSRFFNVLRLLNRSVPLIAVQLSAFKFDDSSIGLNAVKVLDVIEETDDTDLPEQLQTDRAYWEARGYQSSLHMMDRIVTELGKVGIQPRLTYNKHHIALGSTATNFCWFHPRKTSGYCYIELKEPSDLRDEVLTAMQAKGLDANPRRADRITINLNTKQLEDHLHYIADVLKSAEAAS